MPTKKKQEAQAAPEVSAADAKAALAQLKKGATLGSQRDRLGLSSNGPLRTALRELLGGKTKYSQMMKKCIADRESRTPKPGT